MEMFNIKDYNVANLFKTDASLPKASASSVSEARKTRVETELYYFEVIHVMNAEQSLV